MYKIQEYKDLVILVVEDNITFYELIRLLLQEIGIYNCYSAANFTSGIEIFEKVRPNICLVDIDLGKGEKTGINFVEKIREVDADVPVIYLTSNYSEEYYYKCRHTHPSSFMNKELSRFKLFQAIDIAMSQLPDLNPKTATIKPLPLYVAPSNFFFKVGDVYKSIPVDQVSYFFSDNKLNYARVDQRNFPTSVQLKTIADEFHPSFVRIHKSYLVNVKMISDIRPGDSTVQINGESLPIGYAYKKSFFDHIHLLK